MQKFVSNFKLYDIMQKNKRRIITIESSKKTTENEKIRRKENQKQSQKEIKIQKKSIDFAADCTFGFCHKISDINS